MARKRIRHNGRRRGAEKNPASKRYKYLGKRVPDINKQGLDSVKEFKRIKQEILKDYRNKRITEKEARGRLLLLYHLTYKKNNSKIRHLSNRTLKRLRLEIKDAMKAL